MSQLRSLLLVLLMLTIRYSSACGGTSGGLGVNGRNAENSISSDRMISYPWQSWNPYDPYRSQYQPISRAPQDTVEVGGSISSYPYPGNIDSCRSSCTGEKGNCLDSQTCSLAGGRASGSCANGFVCCINVVNSCHSGWARHADTVILNNTYWQSSLRPIKPSSSCSLTVKLDSRWPAELPPPNPPTPFFTPVCQVRLDFLVFTISQPDSESVCSGDYFEVAGATNTVPNICGFNDGQHMYLHVPNSAIAPTDLQLTFNFGSSNSEVRAWNILISMIPCDSPKLAPSDCLQYFTSRTGTVRTFNWRDVTGTATRQLANQDYSICFRAAPTFPRQLCLTPCTVVTTQKAFSLSTPYAVIAGAATITTSLPVADVSQIGSLDCNNDFIVIPGGFNIGNPAPVQNMAFDRYCGEKLNALPRNNASTTICTTATPFRVLYRTNRDETLTSPTADAAPNSIPVNGNRGFCLNFRV
ncbi:uncharacterized protein LOC130689669 [Daphnia carinata]|uniref:uncharacterized protein LOC130689669 n=1 Tax=Daphnia carinata TaxID=120202 RepID=UPI0025809E16|nr:uncharacterized protein LOC130689669 [Daphnia carinata]